MAVGLVLIWLVTSFVSPSLSAVDQLEAAYRAGHITNPIEAMIFLERRKASPSFLNSAISLWVPLLLPYAVFAGVAYLAPRLFRSYVFYWGDAIALHDKWASSVKIFWTIIVLGMLVSIAGGLILHIFVH